MENNENRMNELENKVDKLSDMLGELMAKMAEKANEQKEEPEKTDDKKEESKKEEPKMTTRQKFAREAAFRTASITEEVINHPLKSAAKALIGGGLIYGGYRKLREWMSDNDVYLNNGERPMLPERTNNYDD